MFSSDVRNAIRKDLKGKTDIAPMCDWVSFKVTDPDAWRVVFVTFYGAEIPVQLWIDDFSNLVAEFREETGGWPEGLTKERFHDLLKDYYGDNEPEFSESEDDDDFAPYGERRQDSEDEEYNDAFEEKLEGVETYWRAKETAHNSWFEGKLEED